MTERHAREQALLGVAYTDPATGLPNRAGFLRALEQQLDRGDPVDEETTLMMIELDGLGAAREQVGRDAVTAVEAEVGRRLRATVRSEDVVARLGSGGFAVMGHGEPGEAERLASRLPLRRRAARGDRRGRHRPDREHRHGHRRGRLGRGAVPPRRPRRARRPRGGPGTARRYDPSLGEAADRRDRLRVALQGACADHQLFLMYQPIVALDQQRITGIEAQLRWRHPELGEVPPAEFLPLADRAGLIGELLRWALRKCTAVAAGLTSGGEPMNIGLKVPTGYAATGTHRP